MATEEKRDRADATRETGGGPSGLIDPIDAILALALIAGCAYLYYVSTFFEEPAAFLGENLLPADFPQMLLVLIGAMALILPFEHLFEVERWPLIKKARSAPVGAATYATMAFLVALLALAPTLGTVLTIFLSATLLPILWGERRWLLILVYAVLFTLIVTYVFSIVLSVYFEPGVFNLTLR